jgi:hypothetical protein
MDFVQLSRDPFARQDIIRSSEALDEHGQHSGCAWCGNFRARGEKMLFRYGVWPDSGHSYWHSKAFCSKSCYDSYS